VLNAYEINTLGPFYKTFFFFNNGGTGKIFQGVLLALPVKYDTRLLYYKTFHGLHLRIFVLS
jgi:hypothetical protein